MPVDDDRTKAQKEWADWAEHGYSKRYQPHSVLRFGAIFTVVMAALLVAVLMYATRGLR